MGKGILGALGWSVVGALWACGGEALQPGAVDAPPAACRPLTCASAGAACGSTADGCGATLDCGPCVAPDANACPEGDAAPGCADVRAFRATARWVHPYEASVSSSAAGVAVTTRGEVLLASYVRGVGSVGGQSGGAPEAYSTVLSRHAADGRLLEERWLPGFASDVSLGVTDDGGFTFTANGIDSDLGAGPETAVLRSPLVRFSAEGRLLWERSILRGQEASATDAQGRVALQNKPHRFEDTLPVRLALYGADGRLRWERPLSDGDGLEGDLHFNSLAFAPDGHLLAAGSAWTSFVMDGQRHSFSRLSTPVLLKLDARTGRLLWAVGLDGATGSFTSVALTRGGSIRLQGLISDGSRTEWGSTVLEVPGPARPSNARSILLAAGADGKPEWARVSELVDGEALLLADGEEVVTARRDEECGRTLLQRYSARGELLWSRSPTRACAPGSARLHINGMALLPSRDLVLAGSFRGRIDFGAGALSAEDFNLVLMTMAP